MNAARIRVGREKELRRKITLATTKIGAVKSSVDHYEERQLPRRVLEFTMKKNYVDPASIGGERQWPQRKIT